MKICNKMFAECLGTFVLVLGGCGTALFGHVGFLGVAIAFGLTVIAMAYGVGHISGAHLNPAVSFGVWVNGRMSLKDMLLYWVSQCVGAVIAGAVLLVIWNAAGMGQTGVFAANGYGAEFAAATGNADYLSVSCGGAFLVEALLTFVFLMVILGVTDDRHANGKFGGLAIGLTLVLIHIVAHARIENDIRLKPQKFFNMSVQKLCREAHGIGRYGVLTCKVELAVRIG